MLSSEVPTQPFDCSSPSLTSVLSINAAISASVVLASRLPDDISVFALMLYAVVLFAMFPVLRHRLQVSAFVPVPVNGRASHRDPFYHLSRCVHSHLARPFAATDIERASLTSLSSMRVDRPPHHSSRLSLRPFYLRYRSPSPPPYRHLLHPSMQASSPWSSSSPPLPSCGHKGIKSKVFDHHCPKPGPDTYRQ